MKTTPLAAAIALSLVTASSLAAATLSFEAESLAVTNSGTGTTLQTDASCSGGKWVSLDAENAGSWFELTTPSLAAGTYTLKMSYKTNNNRGQLTLKVDGTTVGGTLDQYAFPSVYPEATFGSVTFTSAAAHTIRLTVTGKNASSSSYVLSADRFTMEGSGSSATPTPTPTPAPGATPTPTPTATPGEGACARTVNVASSSALSSAASGARPGDCIVVASGSYSAFTVTADGTSASPIVIRAATRGAATISSGILRLSGASYVTVDGFRITSAGGSATLDDVSRKVIVSIADSNNCRITRCNFKPTGHANGTSYVMLNGNSNKNRVDHNDFGPNTVDSVHYVWPTGNATIPGVTKPADRTNWANYQSPYNARMARDTQIDHNYLHDMAPGTAECVVLGGVGMTGDYQDLRTVFEYNLLTSCDGDPEVVSIKSSSNVIRYNTFRTSAGGIVSRAGNKNQIYGNFMLQGGKAESIGVRLHEKDHTVYNNYIERAARAPIIVASGDRYDGTFAHAQVVRARIVHNTMISFGESASFGSWGNNELAPVDCVFANNILTGSGTLVTLGMPGNTIFANNIYQGTLGVSRSQGEFWNVNPQLTTVSGLQKLSASSPAIGYANTSYGSFVTDDMDGQGRSDPDAGADEYSTGGVLRRPLTTSDVGPNAP